MITGDYEQLKDLAMRYVCRDDQGMLTMVWNAEENTYALRCQHNHFPEEITRRLSLTEEHKAGAELPEPIKSNVEKEIRQRAQGLSQAPQAETFVGIPGTDLGTGELLPVAALKGLITFAETYGLDAARVHVCLMYGQPYVTLDGYLFKANTSGEAYTLGSRPMNQDERSDSQIEDGDHAWIAHVKKLDTGAEFMGLGIVTKEEMTEESKKRPGQLKSPVVARHPWQLGQKRAEWQALRRGFPIGEVNEEVDNGQGEG